MEDIRVLVMTNFTYVYGGRASYKHCGESLYFNPSSVEQMTELKSILSSSYMKKGWLYVEEYIKEDFANKSGVFTEETPAVEEVPATQPTEETAPSEQQTESSLEEDTVTKSVEDRKQELNDLLAADIRKIAEELNIEYTTKVKTIEAILKVEYPELQ